MGKRDKKDAFVQVGGAGVTVVGDIIITESAHVDGTVNGNIKSSAGTLTVGAVVNGDITGVDVVVLHNVEGNITAQTLRIASTGAIKGNVTAKVLIVEEGAYLHGKCDMASSLQEVS